MDVVHPPWFYHKYCTPVFWFLSWGTSIWCGIRSSLIPLCDAYDDDDGDA